MTVNHSQEGKKKKKELYIILFLGKHLTEQAEDNTYYSHLDLLIKKMLKSCTPLSIISG